MKILFGSKLLLLFQIKIPKKKKEDEEVEISRTLILCVDCPADEANIPTHAVARAIDLICTYVFSWLSVIAKSRKTIL